MKYIDMGPWPCMVGFCDNPADFRAEMDRIDCDDPPEFLGRNTAAATTHRFRSSGDRVIIVTVDPAYRRNAHAQVAGLMAHEATHVVEFLREDVNYGDPLGGEAEAYMVQYLTQSFLNLFWQTGDKIRKKPR